MPDSTRTGTDDDGDDRAGRGTLHGSAAAGVRGGEGLQGEGSTRRWSCGYKGVWEPVRGGCALRVLPVNAGCGRSAAGDAVPAAALRGPGSGGNR